MAVKNKKSVKAPVKGKEAALPSEDVPRVVIDGHGKIVYASPAFAAIAGKSLKKLKNKALTEIMSFSYPEEAQRIHGFFKADTGGKWVDTLQEGLHPVTTGNPDQTLYFQFDKITMPDKRVFVVATRAGSNTEKIKNHKSNSAYTREMVKFVEKLESISTNPAIKKISAVSDEVELRHFLNMSNDMMSIFGRDGVFLRANHTFNDVLGYTDEDLAVMSFMDLVYEEDRPHVRASLQSMMHEDAERDHIIDFEARITARDGAVRWMVWRKKRCGDHIYSVGHDITDIKQHEIAQTQQQQKLSEAQAIGRMGHWHWCVGEDYIEWSDEIYRIFGVEKDIFKPTLENMNNMLHRRDLGRLLQAFQRAIIEQNNYDMDFRINRPDGETRYIRCEGKCEKDSNDEVVALFGIMQDITERTLYEREMREAKEAAEHAYAAKTQFLANMSHELRTPLNAIIGFSEMMQRQLLGPIGTERYLDYITGIRESGEHLLDLISDILDMSKIEAGKYELDLEELKVAKIIRLAIHMMEGRALEAGIKISLKADDEELQITADRRAVMQIILNLLSNAVKFTESGGSVNIECIKREDYLSVKVQDTGIGIPANKLKTITRPFEQAASHYTKSHEGTGLGLAITKELIELHGGTLHIDSTVGVGTVVTVRLPHDTRARLKQLESENIVI